MNFTIRLRLRLLVALMLVLMLVLGFTGYHGMASADSGLDEVVRSNHALRTHMEGDMMHDALRADVLAALLAETPDDWQRVNDDLHGHAKLFRDSIESNSKASVVDTRQLFEQLGPVLEKYIQSAESLIALAKKDKAAAHAALPGFLDVFSELEGKLSHVSDVIEHGSNEAETDANQLIATARTIGMAILVVAIVLALVSAQLMARAITQGLNELVTFIDKIAQGDLATHIEVKRRDEFGELLESLKQMSGKLNRIIGTVRSKATQTMSSARELTQGSDDLSQRTQEQAASLEEAAASMEQMAATIKQNADHAREASQLALGAHKQADNGSVVVQQAVSAMDEINSSSRKIADIIGVIDEIAFQTNLLALNAAVEAARAGEQGRGFAVVASEVRNLAQRSGSAAKEIKALISESVDKVRVGASLVDQSGKAIEELMLSVKRVSNVVAEISVATQEQAAGVDQVNLAVTQMDQVTQQNAALVEEAAAASKNVDLQTTAMLQEMSFFKTDAATQSSGYSQYAAAGAAKTAEHALAHAA